LLEGHQRATLTNPKRCRYFDFRLRDEVAAFTMSLRNVLAAAAARAKKD
jgi:hypothetical protein